MRGQEREKYEMDAKGIKGYRSERELRVLSCVALGGNKREKKWSEEGEKLVITEVKDAERDTETHIHTTVSY